MPAKVDGTASFGLDIRLPGMLYAAVRMCPMLGGSPGAINPASAMAMPGVERLVRLQGYAGSSAGFAVVGKTCWHAQQAALAVQGDWQPRTVGAPDTRQIEKNLLLALERDGDTSYDKESVDTAELNSSRKVEALYRVPFLAHATLEPMNCTAQVLDGKVNLWVPTQVPQMTVSIAARVAGLPVENVYITTTPLGGGFGRRLEVDVVAQAVRAAMECGGRPVQLIWLREEDMAHDSYRPMQVAVLRAAVDPAGPLTSLRIKSAGDAILPRWVDRVMPALNALVDMADMRTSEGLFDLPYGFAHQ